MPNIITRGTRIVVLSLVGAQILAVGCNALIMLGAPEFWYAVAPGIQSTGPLNSYMVREIGVTELVIAALYAIGTARARWRFSFWMVAAIWQTLRLLRLCVSEATLFWSALPYIVLPAIIGLLITAWARANNDQNPGTDIVLEEDWTFETIVATGATQHPTVTFQQENHLRSEARMARRG